MLLKTISRMMSLIALIFQTMDAHEIKAIQWVLYDDDRLNHLFASHSKFIERVMESIMVKKIEPF